MKPSLSEITRELTALAAYCANPDISLIREELSYCPGYGTWSCDPARIVGPSESTLNAELNALADVAEEIRLITEGGVPIEEGLIDEWLIQQIMRWGNNAPHIAYDCNAIANLIRSYNG